MKQNTRYYFVAFISICCLITGCTQKSNPRMEPENPGAPAIEESISSMTAYLYYAQQDYMRTNTPYTYTMNKYLDIALEYIYGWDNMYPLLAISLKQSMIDNYGSNNSTLEDEILCNTTFDAFFNTLYDSLIVELNSFAIIQNRMVESRVISETDSADFDYFDMMIPIGDALYSKLDILYYYENQHLMPHEAFDEDEVIAIEGCDCNCTPNYSPSRQQNQPHKLSRASWRMLWLDDIRYRNYNNQCPNMTELTGAMATWEEASNYAIHFREISDNGWNRFSWGIGCNYHICLSKTDDPNVGGNSTLGCIPWAIIHLGNAADYGTCLHELGHTLGLIHEQCRPDRDCYVDIDWNNIKSGYKHDFEKEWCVSADMYGDFDFESIMMYPDWAFSLDGSSPTITKKDGSSYVWNHTHLSINDIQYIKYLYHD